MFVPMAMQEQWSVMMLVALVTIKGHAEKSLVWACPWDQVDVQGLCRAGPSPRWLGYSGELAWLLLFLLIAILRECLLPLAGAVQ